MTADPTPRPRPRKKVATTRSRAVAAGVSALAFFGIGAAIGARATNTGVTTASGPTVNARVADPAPATSWVWVRSSEDDEGGRSGGTWVAVPGTTTVQPGKTAPTAPTTTSGGSTVAVP